MDKLKTIFGIFLIGFLIYFYIEDFPGITRKIQNYIYNNTSFLKSLYSPFRQENISKSNDNDKVSQTEESVDNKEEGQNLENDNRYSQNMDKYEKKAEEEIDKLLELKWKFSIIIYISINNKISGGINEL